MPRKKKDDTTKKMFRDPSGQYDSIGKFYEQGLEPKRNQPVKYLGMMFPSHAAWREYFLTSCARI